MAMLSLLIIVHDDGFIDVEVGGIPCNFLIDSGSTCNVVDKACWEELKKKHIKYQSQKTTTQIYAYGSTESLKVAGKFVADVVCEGREVKAAEFVVTEGTGKPLLGKKTAVCLGILTIGPQPAITENAHSLEDDVLFGERMMAIYSKCFTGIGKLKDRQLKIDIDLVAQNVRKITYGLQSKVEKKLDELEAQGMIEKVDGPVKWTNLLVFILKPNGEVRLCRDKRKANEAIIREKFPIPKVDDILHEINGCKVFSKLDLKYGYHQLELHEKSRDITTTVTHKGHYPRYPRLIFGMNNAAEAYQYHVGDAIRDCEGVRNISDDTIVHGKNQAEDDERLTENLARQESHT